MQAAPGAVIPILAGLLEGGEAPPLKNAALLALQRYPDENIGSLVASAW